MDATPEPTLRPTWISCPQRRILFLLGLFGLGVGGGVMLDRQVLSPPSGPHTLQEQHLGGAPLLNEAWNAIRTGYVDQSTLHSRKFTYAAIGAMVDALGDTEHSQFLTPEMRREENEEMDGEFSGIGVRLEERNSQIVISSVFDNAPAQRRELRAGDVILAVGGQGVAGMSAAQVLESLRGPSGSPVQLLIKAAATGKASRLNLVRQRLGQASVAWTMLPDRKVALVKISVFSSGTTDGLARALAAIRKAGADRLILDLRDNPGGYLTEAVGVASQFLTTGNVVLEKDARGRVTPTPVRAGGGKNTLPLAVLINHESASAAEIVAGALQDHQRAILIGETSFGAGSILQEFPLSDGSSLMLAIEEWLTPNGRKIWHRGIIPDVALSLPAATELLHPQKFKAIAEYRQRLSQDAQMQRALNVLVPSPVRALASKPNADGTDQSG
jgi:carboxyl-terminal processing protease